MKERIDRLLEMAEWLAAHGERDLARRCRDLATRMLDMVMYNAMRRKEYGK